MFNLIILRKCCLSDNNDGGLWIIDVLIFIDYFIDDYFIIDDYDDDLWWGDDDYDLWGDEEVDDLDYFDLEFFVSEKVFFLLV